MNFRQLEYFLAVANAGQITAAAQQLHMAQPPLSYQLKQLETEMGVTLLNRQLVARHCARGAAPARLCAAAGRSQRPGGQPGAVAGTD